MRVLDLFAGLGGFSAAFRDRGHEVTSLDVEERFRPTLRMDVRDFHGEPGLFDVVLASPPCQAFSVARIAANWVRAGEPRTEKALLGMDLVRAANRVIRECEPRWWVLENPVGMLRKLDLVPGAWQTTTYCQYGASWRKATDLWGRYPLVLKRRCRNRMDCHEPAHRGSKTGVQGTRSPALRALIPYPLSLALCRAMEKP